jgi:hypothetical protein
LSVAAENPRSAFVDRGIDFDAAYEKHVPLITGVAIERFHIAEIDAKTLAHEVFLAYFFKANDVRDIRAWFLGAICNASRHTCARAPGKSPCRRTWPINPTRASTE